METVDTDVFWSRVVDAPDCFGELQATDAAWHERAVVVWRVVGETLVQREGNDMLVAAWENNLGLAAADGAEPGARKVALLNHMCSEGLPVPAGLLESVLTRMLGEGRARVKHSGDTLTVSVALDTTEEQIAEVQKMLDRVLPRNLVTEMEWAGGLPIDYTPLEYIESTGTQYIDTGILATGQYKVQFSALSRKWDGYSNSNTVFFAYEGGLWFFYSMNWQGIYGSAGQRGYGYQRYSLEYPPMHELNVRYDVVLDRAKTIRNGVELGTIGGEFVEENFEFSRVSILLFNRTDAKAQPTSKVLYSFSIEDNGIPVVNYIPALNPEGQPGLYDTVSKAFKVNIGTGDFLYPGKEEEATTYSLRRRDYAKLTEHGVRRLYHVPKGCTLSKEEYAEQNGFKILVETPMPEEGYWEPVWHEREDCIELDWEETEAPAEAAEGEVTEN